MAGTSKPVQIRGRGASENPPNRFETLSYERDPDSVDAEEPSPQTVFLKDASRSFIAYNDSPDVGFDASINPYRGCEHGCIYCYARPTHEYLGMSAGVDFETRILVKEDGPQLLRQELSSRKWKPQIIAISGVTDAYQPAERRFGLTRACLEVLLEFRNPVMIVTKNHLVTRDADLLSTMAAFDAAAVLVSITTLDAALAGVMEPRASAPARRLAAIEELARAGVPVGVMVAPVIPALNDHEITPIIRAAAAAGAQYAGYVMMRLPHAVKDLFESWLERNFPDRRKKVLSRVRDVRGGKLNDPRFRSRMKGEGVFAEQVRAMFHIACKKAGILGRAPVLSAASFRRPEGPQLTLFG
ncbi:MAG TPA: PA0069 family radical SAM protein [Blastocatellia bacterium]|nr:PA0069 family radical SAM protein [Blastocatellia bacterium]